ncbi:ubiquinol-cytochrome C reductase [Candidatus Pelagibacter sp.]|nr:ubiquinol-cytochrome C reductase [Candidatus Pelagibacter sp.]
MNYNYINIYNNLVNLTRNKTLYEQFTKQDTFSDRLIIFLFHFAFFLNIYKLKSRKKILQELFDYTFRQIELSIREIGYGDATINKKMKIYINIFYSILEKVDKWESQNIDDKNMIFAEFLDLKKNNPIFVNYFNNYRLYLRKNTFNSVIKGVIKIKI